MKAPLLKYHQVRDTLLQWFRDQGYTPGTKLPTEQELTTTLGVSRTTVRQALEVLKNQGLIEKKQGSGAYYRGISEVPNEEDRGQSEKGFIGLVNFSHMDYIYPEIIQGAEETLAQAGFSLAIAPSNQNVEKEYQSIIRLIDQGIKGLIIEPSKNLQINEAHPIGKLLKSLTIPVIATHWGISNQTISTVTVDDLVAGYDATKYLLDHGHSRIGMIFKSDVQSGHDRFDGYLRALKEAGIVPQESWSQSYDQAQDIPGTMPVYDLTNTLLDRMKPLPTAIFYFNDMSAYQGYRAIFDRGLKIPDDISVLGFDNHHGSSQLYPPLTTYEHPKYELGRWAARLLLSELEPRKPALHVKLVFEPKLVERGSVRIV